MPFIKIEIIKGHSKDYKDTLFRSVHDAIVSALYIQENTCIQRIYELDECSFELSPGKTEKFTLIEITILPGRSAAMKKSVIIGIISLLGERLQIPPADIIIIIHEQPLENFGFRGQHAIEMDLQYKKDV